MTMLVVFGQRAGAATACQIGYVGHPPVGAKGDSIPAYHDVMGRVTRPPGERSRRLGDCFQHQSPIRPDPPGNGVNRADAWRSGMRR